MTKRESVIARREIHVEGKTLVWTFEHVPETIYNTGGFVRMTDENGEESVYGTESMAILENLIRLGVIGHEKQN